MQSILHVKYPAEVKQLSVFIKYMYPGNLEEDNHFGSGERQLPQLISYTNGDTNHKQALLDSCNTLN